MDNATGTRGYKVFDSDWTCRGFQFEVGKTFEEDRSPKCCERGFHFCLKLVDCFNYYGFNPNNKVAEIIAIGKIDKNELDSKCCTNKIKILKELTWDEVLEKVNTGTNCTGNRNSGNWNSGDWNSGDWNSGSGNSGGRNSGDWNSGDWNSGDWNSGSGNSGGRNSGNGNSGNWNSGGRNSGNGNSGNGNSGNRNSGDWNSGDWNSGDWNSGNRNSGDGNSGDGNSGDWNSGDWNSGDWNITNYSSGCFNTEEQKLLFFDKPTKITMQQWRDSEAFHLLKYVNYEPVIWVEAENMTEVEKRDNPGWEATGGYLKKNILKNCFAEWWENLLFRERKVIQEIPNFDSEKFYQITGIKIRDLQ